MGLLDGKAAIVTGAGRGIGRGEALELATQGAKVVVNDIGTSLEGDGTDERVADAVAVEIRESGGEAVANYDDISTWDGARALIDQAVEHYGRLDVVVNNAGNLRDSEITNMSEDDWDAVIRVHLKGTFLTTRHAASYWRSEKSAGRQPRAAIINTSSRAGLPGDGGRVNYSAAKAGIAALTIVSSFELAKYGVRANAIAPYGFTRMWESLVEDTARPRETGEYAEFDMKDPGNVAPLVAFLASDEALHITGQVFRVLGNRIILFVPWQLGSWIEAEGRWNAADIGSAMNSRIFRSVAPHVGLADEMRYIGE